MYVRAIPTRMFNVLSSNSIVSAAKAYSLLSSPWKLVRCWWGESGGGEDVIGMRGEYGELLTEHISFLMFSRQHMNGDLIFLFVGSSQQRVHMMNMSSSPKTNRCREGKVRIEKSDEE